MSFTDLKQAVFQANIDLVKAGLVVLTWGNASAIDRAAGVIAIKPSGVPYDTMTPDDMVLLSLETGGKMEEAGLNPSSDAPTHVLLYQTFPEIGGVIHTHSAYATAWAQAKREIPCFGTTHADGFYGAVPLTRELTPEEIAGQYEHNTGKVIVERFRTFGLNPMHYPAALVPCHGPFTWGKDAHKALENAIVLEEVAKMAFRTELIAHGAESIPQALLDKHFLRKHGAGAYYGQRKSEG